jgi:hypothetical protein
MRETWSFESAWAELIVGLRARADERQLIDALPPCITVAEIGRWFEDPQARRSLIEIYEQLSAHGPFGDASPADEMEQALVPAIEAALRDGRLVAIRVAPRISAGIPEAQREEKARPAAARETRGEPASWISIELVDEDGAPVPHQRYRVTSSDGAVREGLLDEMGRASVRGIAPGECMVTFVDLDDEAWSAA